MGPISLSWYDDNDIPGREISYFSTLFNKEIKLNKEIKRTVYDKTFCVGRIDIHHPDLPYGDAYGAPMMSSKSWGLLGSWLTNLSLKELPSRDTLFEMFEEDTQHKIEWFDCND
jgi:hypothetical protein